MIKQSCFSLSKVVFIPLIYFVQFKTHFASACRFRLLCFQFPVEPASVFHYSVMNLIYMSSRQRAYVRIKLFF